MKSKWLSVVFVSVQFISLALIGLTGPIFAPPVIWLGIELLGLFLGFWAVAVMRIGHFNITPDPLSWSKLVSWGPYRIIRHPMYLALLLTTLPLVISYFSMLRLVFWLALLADLVLKMGYEEGLLQQRFPEYASYQQQTARLLPGIY
jgi:protein-S-isoprenylcysteine O-methyltransferase Ste14